MKKFIIIFMMSLMVCSCGITSSTTGDLSTYGNIIHTTVEVFQVFDEFHDEGLAHIVGTDVDVRVIDHKRGLYNDKRIRTWFVIDEIYTYTTVEKKQRTVPTLVIKYNE